MANEKPEIELSKRIPEQVKKLEGELTGLIGARTPCPASASQRW